MLVLREEDGYLEAESRWRSNTNRGAQDIVEVGRNMDGNLSRFSQVCQRLGESSLSAGDEYDN